MAKDTSSMITTSQARSFTVLDDEGEYAGAAQQFSTARQTEVEAVENVTNPQRHDELTDEEIEAEMLARGYVRCQGRCHGAFKHHSDFTRDERNIERLHCHVYCKQCRAEYEQRKRAALHSVQAVVRYEYRQRKKKRQKTR